MILIIVVIVLSIVVFVYYFKAKIVKLLKTSAGKSSALPYRKRDYLLTKAERSFYGLLTSLVQHRDVVVFAKVRLGDLLYLPSNTKERTSYWNKVQAKHIDFVLCDSATVKPLLAIELNDSSHKQQSRAERDDFVCQALEAAGLPFIAVPVRHDYDLQDLSTRIDEAMSSTKKPTPGAEKF